MEKIRQFTDLVVWQKAHQLVLEVYRMCALFPKEEMYGLTSQLKRASISIPANIAEGFKRASRLEKLRFYNISQASLSEVQYYLILTKDLKFADTYNLTKQAEEVDRILFGLIISIRDNDK
jgi:four helix bundle protein